MKHQELQSENYVTPSAELVFISLTKPLLTSPLENPEEGGQWTLDP